MPRSPPSRACRLGDIQFVTWHDGTAFRHLFCPGLSCFVVLCRAKKIREVQSLKLHVHLSIPCPPFFPLKKHSGPRILFSRTSGKNFAGQPATHESKNYHHAKKGGARSAGQDGPKRPRPHGLRG